VTESTHLCHQVPAPPCGRGCATALSGQPGWRYGASKFMVRMIQNFGVAHGLKWIALRHINVAGADHEREIGEDHSPESHLILLVVDLALGRRPSVTTFGSDYPTLDGTCIRTSMFGIGGRVLPLPNPNI